jgi:hypothetical protein
MWEIKPLKLSILVPTRDTVHSQFAYCLTQLYNLTREAGIDAYLFFDSSTILLNQRNNLVKKAKEVNSDYILWLDSDMTYPATTALRLLEHNKDIVACNYSKRTKPLKTVAYTNLNDWDSWVHMEPQDELVKVEGVGMGCMLMKLDIFEKLQKPYFEFRYKEDTQDYFGEDFILLGKLREQGYDVFIDTVLSMDIKHLGIYAF